MDDAINELLNQARSRRKRPNQSSVSDVLRESGNVDVAKLSEFKSPAPVQSSESGKRTSTPNYGEPKPISKVAKMVERFEMLQKDKAALCEDSVVDTMTSISGISQVTSHLDNSSSFISQYDITETPKVDNRTLTVSAIKTIPEHTPTLNLDKVHHSVSGSDVETEMSPISSLKTADHSTNSNVSSEPVPNTVFGLIQANRISDFSSEDIFFSPERSCSFAESSVVSANSASANKRDVMSLVDTLTSPIVTARVVQCTMSEASDVSCGSDTFLQPPSVTPPKLAPEKIPETSTLLPEKKCLEYIKQQVQIKAPNQDHLSNETDEESFLSSEKGSIVSDDMSSYFDSVADTERSTEMSYANSRVSALSSSSKVRDFKSPCKTLSPCQTPPSITVEMYRSAQKKPKDQTRREEDDSSRLNLVQFYSDDESVVDPSQPKEYIVALKKDAVRQESTIHQATKALSMCKTVAQTVDSFKVLIIACQRRQHCLAEASRLDSLLSKSGDAFYSDTHLTATLNISNILLPLRVDALLPGERHYFLCFFKCPMGRLITTEMVSGGHSGVSGSSKSCGTLWLEVPNSVNIGSLRNDFNVVFSVYWLRTKDDTAHATPSKRRKLFPKLGVGAVLNPGTEPASPSLPPGGFTLLSDINLTLSSVNNSEFDVRPPHSCPLGKKVSLHCSLQLQSSRCLMSGFLSWFSQTGEFGAWHRRWTGLYPDKLVWWKYPDQQEREEEWLGKVDLRLCPKETVCPADSELCMRPNTLLLETVRPSGHAEEESLTCSRLGQGRMLERFLLSAESRAERQEWLSQLNKVLHQLKSWCPAKPGH